MSQLALYFLGTPRIERDGEAISLSHHKALALLAYLAIIRQPHSRPALAAFLWPDYESTAARAELRRMLWVLNKSLGQGWLAVDRETVLLPPQPGLWLDTERFRELLAMDQQHHHPAGEVCPACLEPLTAAVALIRGDFLTGFTLPDNPDFDTWQTFETESLRRELAGALERLVHLLVQRGETGEPAINYARRWLALDPLHEPAHRHLMELYTWAGQPAAALRQYQVCAQVLKEELGIDPSPETTALYDTIKANRLPPPTGAVEQKRGTAPSISSMSAGSAVPPHNLPVQTTPFIGREAALASMQQRLADPEVRLMTIVGPGGIGKTRLALALAERQLQPATAFPDGVYFISLAPIDSIEVLAQTIAEGLAFPLTSTQEPAVQLLAYLRPKQMLLILDNFEHILAGAALVSQILQTAAGVKLLATSRERLNLAHETLWPIGGLDFAPLISVETAQTYDAVQLFIQRAQRIRPDFILRIEDLPHLERILKGVWSMPLAIELAAAWLNMLSLAEIATELGQGLDLLESELRDLPGRHRSMRLVFDRSWERLDADEQALLKRLSIFRGGFTREAARQVAGASLRVLAGLVNKSLLTSQPDRGRYELHELIRQYGAAHLHADADDERITRDRHSHYYLTLLQAREPDLTSSRQIETLAELSAEIDNLRTAWEWAVVQQQIDLMRRALWSLWYFYELCNFSQEGEVVLGRAAEMVQMLLAERGSHGPELEREKLAGLLDELQAHQAFFNLRQGHRSQTITLFESSICLLRTLHEPAMLAHALAHYGAFYWNMGQFDKAAQYLRESLEISRPLKHPWQLAIFTSFMGVVVHEQGDYDEAYRLLSEAITYGRTLGDPRLISFIGSFLSRTALALGQLAEVQDLLREGLRLVRETGDRFGIGLMLERMAVAAQSSGNDEEARRLFDESIALYRDIGDPWSLSRALTLQGHFVLAKGDHPQARESFRQAAQIALAARIDPNALDALAGLAILYERESHPASALGLATHILQHPASTQDAKDRAENLRLALAAQLSPQQLEAVQAQSFETMVQELLGLATSNV